MNSEPYRSEGVSRRTVMAAAGSAAAWLAGGAGAESAGSAAPAASGSDLQPAATKGNIRHSVCLWCYKMPTAEMAPIAKRLGLVGIDLLKPEDFPVLKEHGLIGTMTNGVWGGIQKGLNRKEHHEPIVQSLRELIDATAAAGFPNVICFSGNRDGISDEEGLANCAAGLKQIVGHAEQRKVTLQMELLNSKVNHHDYQCDHSAWGVELCKRVGSERFKLLYDIYHMQIQEGDVIRTIQEHHPYFGHYHTGGNPGRNEIDETQELNYAAIMKAIVATGYQGVVAQEFIPKRPDKIASLAQAVRICDV